MGGRQDAEQDEGKQRRQQRSAVRESGLFCNRSGRRLVHLEDLICAHVFEGLRDAAGPADFDGLGEGFGAEAKVDTLVARR